MRYRRDLWTDLLITAQLVIDGRSSPAALRLVSDSARYLPHDGRDFVAMNNALKALAATLQHAGDDTRPHIEAAIKSVCSTLTLWPAHERLSYLQALGLRKAAS